MVNKLRIHALLLSCVMASSALLRAQSAPAHDGLPADVRARYTVNDNWKFSYGEINLAWSPSVSDASWESVSIPHTWNAHDVVDDVPGYARGIGWYRKELRLDSALAGKRIFLYFEGANQVADLYVNGAFVGEHKGGYTAFAFDITSRVKFDGKQNANLIAVKVDNSQNPFIPPLSVGYALYGGIYRDVWVIATNPVHLAVTDHASSGVAISTPHVSSDSGDVRVAGTVANDSSGRVQLRVVSSVVDRNGARVAEVSSTVVAQPGEDVGFTQTVPVIRHPHLWSPDDPYLYRVYTAVYEDDALRDRIENPLGFRWFSFDPNHGFSLNGKKLQLRGTTRHQDLEGIGSALSNAQHERDMELIKEMGANFVRLAHYPQDPAVLDAADRLGLLIWEEIPVVNYITVAPEFTQNAHEMMREMIRQHRNHPAVIAWGLMNEVFLWSPEGARIGKQTDTTYMRHVHDFAAGLDSLVHREDSSRYIAMAMHASADYDRAGIASIPQVIGLNLYSGWYGGTFAGFGTALDNRHAREPKQNIFVSEYGAGEDERINSLEPERFDFSSNWQRLFHEAHLRQIAARPWLAGTAIWNEFDFSQPETGGSMPYVNNKGMLTWDRKPKDVFYLYKANWNPEPMVRIASRSWTHRTGTNASAPYAKGPVPVMQPVEVYSNLDRVELLLNGRSLGAKSPDDVRSATWQVPFTQGENVIEARGKKNGRTYTDRLDIEFTYRPPRLDDPSVPFHELAVDVGSRAQFTDGNVVWEGDQPYLPGSFGYVGGDAKMFDKDLPITSTSQVPLYFTYRSGIGGYRIDVPNGDYEVEMLFAEPLALAPGERVFQVAINGRTVVPRLDLAAQGRIASATPMTFNASVADGKGLSITFQSIHGEPILNAIRVTRR
jgi:beta-galactosidase